MSADFADGDPGSRLVAAKLCSPARDQRAVVSTCRAGPTRCQQIRSHGCALQGVTVFAIAAKNWLIEENSTRQRVRFSTTNCC
jgi:hypothetical protein